MLFLGGCNKVLRSKSDQGGAKNGLFTEMYGIYCCAGYICKKSVKHTFLHPVINFGLILSKSTAKLAYKLT